MKETQPQQYQYQEGDILFFIAIAALIFSATIIFWPYMDADAAMVKERRGIAFYKTPVIAQEQPNWDSQKAIDIWKLNKKCDYETKEHTLNDYIWEFLTNEMGLSNEAAAGIFGNMMVECGGRSFDLQPYIYSPGGAYYGLCQWGTSNHHSGIRGGTVEQQLEYLRDTIESEMGSQQYQSFRAAASPEEASVIFARWYERCSYPRGRQNEAREAYERFVCRQVESEVVG